VVRVASAGAGGWPCVASCPRSSRSPSPAETNNRIIRYRFLVFDWVRHASCQDEIYWDDKEYAQSAFSSPHSLRTIAFLFANGVVECIRPARTTVVCSPFPSERLDNWKSWLRDDELQRVSNFRKRVDQELFVARRGLARESIAQMRRVKPGSIYFQSESMGKLSWASHDLDHEQSSSIRKLDFSISKSTGIVAISVCESVRVGVDVETIEALPELEMLAMPRGTVQVKNNQGNA
jgi:hypothetical protein